MLGNDQAGVADTAPGTMIGPGNVISANLIGVLISGATATEVTVIGNLIGTDSSGEADLGNAEAGVDIESATGVIVEGNGQGSQVISGNLVGVKINGSSSTGNLVEGNYIGIDKAGTADRGNASDGVLIEEASDNTVGGTTAAARNVISANEWGIRLDGSTATGNSIEGNDIGTDSSGTLPLGNEINGIIFSNSASDNTVGGTASRSGQHDCLQRRGRGERAVGDGRLDPVELDLLQRPPGNRSGGRGRSVRRSHPQPARPAHRAQ